MDEFKVQKQNSRYTNPIKLQTCNVFQVFTGRILSIFSLGGHIVHDWQLVLYESSKLFQERHMQLFAILPYTCNEILTVDTTDVRKIERESTELTKKRT